MSDEGRLPSSSGQTSASGDGVLDEGRRYWKAAIAHLAPEKREAAWEFYLDRLESSAAADTLGGVMLLLEAHLAFFDGLPARLGLAAQQIEAAFQTPGQPTTTNGVGASPAVAKMAPASAPRWRWRAFLVPSASAAVGGIVVYVALVTSRHFGPPVPANIPIQTNRFLFTRANSIRVEPWSEPTTHRQRGVIVSFGGVAWTERTSSGGAKVYVLSPVEEVRRDLEALRGASE